MPLGAEWRGVCTADPATEREPAEQTQRDICNCGYGRGACSWFPADGEADAVRFSVITESNGASTVRYILERDYSPLSHGTFEWPGDAPDGLASQAAAFMDAYGARRLRA